VNEHELLVVKNLKKYFPIKKRLLDREQKCVKAVDDISFSLNHGETLGLVGESGCGKSTVGRTILRLLEPTEGSVCFEGVDLCALKENELREKRKDFQIIFQDPFSSLDSRFRIEQTLKEPMQIQKMYSSKKEMDAQVAELMNMVGLRLDYANRYPHEFSGGQRQRINIARALAVQPKLIVCDECVSALDVSIQAQIINLLVRLRREMGLAYLFISHDLRVVKHISDRIAVMYLGALVEISTKDEIFSHPAHPYTKSLLSAVPSTDPTVKKERILLSGDIPSPINTPNGCRFHTRCYKAKKICEEQSPELRDLGGNHCCACFFPE
jgi:oligopeptide/dipeptide ABC transporter ATP-binding protein